jgi:hypothetical protein
MPLHIKGFWLKYNSQKAIYSGVLGFIFMSEDKSNYKSYQTIYTVTPPPSSPAWNLDRENVKSIEITLGLTTYEHLRETSAEEQRLNLQNKLKEKTPNIVVALKSIKSLDEIVAELKR